MIRKAVFLLLIAATVAKETTPKSADNKVQPNKFQFPNDADIADETIPKSQGYETQPEKRSVAFIFDAYNAAVRNKLAFLAKYENPPYQIPIRPWFIVDPIPAIFEDSELNLVQAPFDDLMPAASVLQRSAFAPQIVPLQPVYVPVQRRQSAYAKAPFIVPFQKLHTPTIPKSYFNYSKKTTLLLPMKQPDSPTPRSNYTSTLSPNISNDVPMYVF